MGKTSIYGFGYLEPTMKVGENLDLDRLRFLSIESQLYGMATLFGNGVIESDVSGGAITSWQLQIIPGVTDQISITSGRGYVSWMSAETTESYTLDLPISGLVSGLQTYWVYAVANSQTSSAGSVDFIVSSAEILEPDTYVGLGAVVVNTNLTPYAVTCYNTTEYGRQVISLFDSLSSIINNHRHIGGLNNPSQIDLRYHVKGKLDGAYISGIDLGTVTKGTLSPDRLPVIDHNDLLNRGTLTHSQIDDLLADVSQSDSRLFELTIANNLQLALALKRVASPDLSAIDQNLVNAILLIPGISPDTFAADDVTASIPQADYDTVNHQIVGTMVTGTNSDVITWTSREDFAQALLSAQNRTVAYEPAPDNIVVTGTGINASVTLAKPTVYQSVAGQSLANWSIGYIFQDDAAKNGTLQDSFDIQRYFYLSFGALQDWSQHSHVGLNFGCNVEAVVGKIRFFVLLQSGGEAITVTSPSGSSVSLRVSDFPVVYSDSQGEPNTNVYVELALDALQLTASEITQIAGIGFMWDSVDGWDKNDVTFQLLSPPIEELSSEDVQLARLTASDTSSVFIWNTTKFAPEGSLVFRFDSGNALTRYNLLNWDYTLNDGEVIVYARSALSEAGLINKYPVPESTHIIPSDANIGRWFDVIVSLRSKSDLTAAPTLNSLWLAFDVIGGSAEKVWNKRYTDIDNGQTGWMTAESISNISIGSDVVDISDGLTKNYLTIEDTSAIGAFYYLRSSSIYSARSLDGSDEQSVMSGPQASDVPCLSPIEAWNKSQASNLSNPTDMLKQSESYIVADTDNDRLIELSYSGDILRVIQGNVRLNQESRDFVALTASYNPTVGKAYIAFSQNVKIIDPSKCYFVSGTSIVKFSDLNVNAISFQTIDSLSATIEVTLTGSVKALIDTWSEFEVVFQDGSVQVQAPSGDGGGNTTGLSVAPDSLGDQAIVYGSGSTAGSITTGDGFYQSDSSQGLGALGTDYDGDGAVSLSLYGGEARLNVFIGNVFYDNILAPISIQVTDDGRWIVANEGVDSIISYNTDSTAEWKMLSSLVSFVSSSRGNAYETASGHILTSSSVGNKGKVQLWDRLQSVSLFTIELPSQTSYALPYSSSEFYVLMNDLDNEQSRLVKMNASGNVTWSWGLGVLNSPLSLRVLDTGSLLISE